jgi:RNA polymerase sigma factor (sigma-70 family)
MQNSRRDDAAGKPPPTDNSQPINQLSDEDLLNAITGGAAWAMETLYQRYSRTLYSLAYRIVANQRIAEDLLHDVFLSLWNHALPTTPQAGVVRLRLVSLIHHRTIDYVRNARGSKPNGASIEEASRSEQASVTRACDESEQSSQNVQVREALLKLSMEQRMVIELAYFQGWKASEIAEQSQIPLATVKSHMRLGLMNLKHNNS